VRLVIRAPILDLKNADGEIVSIAKHLTKEQFKDLLLQGAEQMARALRGTISNGAVLEPSLRPLLLEGVYVEVEFGSDEEAPMREEDRVPVPPDRGQFVCHKCRAPATSIQVLGVCPDHSNRPKVTLEKV
jgi:hypothetical protein